MHTPSSPLHPAHGLPPVLRRVLGVTLMIGLLASASLWLNTRVGYGSSLCLAAMFSYAALWLAWYKRVRSAMVVHGTLLVSCIMLVGVALQTGGMNSPVLAWVPVLTLPALALLRLRRALFWIGVLQLIQVLLYWAGTDHWISSQVNQSADSLLWTWLTRMQVAASMMLAVLLLEGLYREYNQFAQTRNRELEVTQASLLRAQTHKDEFIASVSHELRTPMNAILGLNQVIRQTLANHPEDVATVTHIHDSTQQLLQVVNDILDYSQLQAGRLSLHPAPFELNRVIQICVNKAQHAAHLKEVTLAVDNQLALPTWVLGDRTRMTQILCNALRNAIAHSPAGHVALVVLRHGDNLRVDIHDERTDMGLIQQLFSSSDPTSRHTSMDLTAQDLSLLIAYHLILLHKGRASALPISDKGTHFWFEVPLHPVEAPKEVKPNEQSPSVRHARWRFLLVDDNQTNLIIGAMALKKCFPGCHVVTVPSGVAALAQLANERFDVLLVDLRMPQMDGLTLARQVRELTSEATSKTPIIALTASTDDQERSLCLASGMQDVLHKPIEETQLLVSVTQVLTSSRADMPHAE